MLIDARGASQFCTDLDIPGWGTVGAIFLLECAAVGPRVYRHVRTLQLTGDT